MRETARKGVKEVDMKGRRLKTGKRKLNQKKANRMN